ncbi:hypothetical protein ACI77O_12345 [Pseudomonas tritici]|uniref:hypothetical protein n=1 Tax=Pseudomonas tritici TaxID=2745518 RepID=UPI00387AD0F7
MSYMQFFFALVGFGLMGWAMTVTKQYVLIGGAIFCWAVIVATQYFFGTPAV